MVGSAAVAYYCPCRPVCQRSEPSAEAACTQDTQPCPGVHNLPRGPLLCSQAAATCLTCGRWTSPAAPGPPCRWPGRLRRAAAAAALPLPRQRPAAAAAASRPLPATRSRPGTASCTCWAATPRCGAARVHPACKPSACCTRCRPGTSPRARDAEVLHLRYRPCGSLRPPPHTQAKGAATMSLRVVDPAARTVTEPEASGTVPPARGGHTVRRGRRRGGGTDAGAAKEFGVCVGGCICDTSIRYSQRRPLFGRGAPVVARCRPR